MSKDIYVVNCYTCQHNGQETCKGCNTLLNGDVEPYENWELREDLSQKDQRIAELEKELAKYKDLQDRLGLENADEFEWFVMLDLLTDNEKNMHILDLHRELAELKEKAIVPKFKVGQEVWWIDTRGNIYNKQNYKIDSYLIDSIVVTDNKFRYYGEDGCWLGEGDLFATEQEAQAKLKEIQGNE